MDELIRIGERIKVLKAEIAEFDLKAGELFAACSECRGESSTRTREMKALLTRAAVLWEEMYAS